MRVNSDPLTEDELAEVYRSRAEARRRALEYADSISDEEDARLTAAAESDPDNPPLTEENWKRMRPAHEVHPHLVRKSLERKRGRPASENPKQQVTLRLDPDILEHFRAGGPGWQTAINDALRKAMKTG
jgi:uncharacterized protein (DUF4415 family)